MDPISKQVNPSAGGGKPAEVISLRDGIATSGQGEASRKNSTPDSGFRSQDNLNVVSSSNARADLITTPRMSFSPADSLDSQMTLVSGVVPQTSSTGAASSEAGSNRVTSLTSSACSSAELNSSNSSTKSGGSGVEKILDDGSREITYSNGNRKLVSPEGTSIKVFYYNGDVKESLNSGLVKYFYSETKTWHLTYPDKKEVLQFSK